MISIAFIISFLGTGCSVFRKGAVSEEYFNGNKGDSLVLRKVQENNISKAGYFIKKAEIEVVIGEQKENMVATVRYRDNGDYLISLRSKTGIEAARVFIGRDTLMINDRINKVMYAGVPEYLERKYSIPGFLLPVIFGDFVNIGTGERIDSVCINGKLNYKSKSDNLGVSYVLDCKVNKTVKAIVETSTGKETISLLYSDFQKTGELAFPGEIVVSGLPDQMILRIKVYNIEIPWSGEMSFIPGNRYEIVRLK